MIQSKPYTIPRTVLSRITALYYLRTFWFVLIGPFLFGIALLFLAPNQTARYFGFFLAVWPMTIFTRALLLTGKAAKIWSKSTVMTVDQGAFLFETQTEPVRRFKLKFESVRKVVPLVGFQLLQTRKFSFVPIPEAALPENVELGKVMEKSRAEGIERK